MSASDETRRIIELLRHHHPTKDGWATFVELREATGYSRLQAIDFFALHTWPSKGFRSIAYEVKVSRSDFKKEIDNPLKRVFAETLAHECLFVVPRGLIQPDEVPDGWGLMVADAGGLKTLKHGTQRKEVKWPQHFMVSMARRMADPPSPLPLSVWKCAGGEIGEDALIEVAERTLKLRLKDEQEKQYNEGYRAAMDTLEYKRMVELRDAVGKAMQYRYVPGITADKFEQWLAAQASGVAVTDLHTLQNARDILNQLIERAQP